MSDLSRSRARLAALVTLVLPATAQSWSDEFARPGLAGRVFATGTYNRQLVAGGLSLQTRGAWLGNLATFDGTRWRRIGGEVKGDVRAIVTYRGELIVAGEVGVAGGVPVDGIARWDGSRWHALPGGPKLTFKARPTYFALAVYAGELYAAGYFNQLAGRPLFGIARWNGTRWADVGGSVAGKFQPTGLSLVVHNNELYLGGTFDRAGFVTTPNIAAWNGTRWRALGGGIPGAINTAVRALESFGGKVYAGGSFSRAGKVAARRIAAWNGRAWSALGGGFPDFSISVTVYSLRAYAGSLYAGGNFIRADSPIGPATIRVGRWDGARWHAFGGIDGSGLKTTAFAMTVHDGKLVVGGEFTRAGRNLGAGQAVVSESIVSFDGKRWGQLGRGLGLDAEPRCLASWHGGIVAVGRFIEAGRSLTSQVGWFDGRDWRHIGTFDGNVNAAVEFNGDLVVTGDFRRLNGQPISGTARFDGRRWHSMTGAGGNALAVYNGSLYAGGLGNAARWTGSSWQRLGSVFGFVLAMHAHGGLLYIGGSSLRATGLPGSPNLIAWDGSKLLGVGGGTSDAVEALASYKTRLVVGGRFQRAGTLPARRIATWDGKAWAQLGAGFGATVHSLTTLAGDLYAGGSFNTFTHDPFDYIARFDGSTWRPLGGGIGGAPLALLGDEATGELYVGGLFGRAGGGRTGGVPAWRMARWETGVRWRDLGAALAGADGKPMLIGHGALRPGNRIELRLAGGRGTAPGVLALGLRRIDLPLLGGLLVPSPDAALTFASDRYGRFRLATTVPAGVRTGIRLYAQCWLLDPAAVQGAAASNAVLGIVP